MKNPNKKLLLVLLIFAFITTTGAKCGSLPGGAIKEGGPTSITLNYWKVYDEKSNFSELINLYKKQNPHVNIVYKTFTPAEYESELVNALAEDRGPDIFSVQTSWMREYEPKILALPATITTYSAFESGTIQKQVYTKANVKNTLTLRNVKELYPDVVYDNQIINSKIYGLPLSLDTMALFYNRDLLNNAGLTAPPSSWDDFVYQVGHLTKKDVSGNIFTAGAALGTAYNVNRATDILSLLMMQSGVQMTDDRGNAIFNKNPAAYSGQTLLSAAALNFYNSFASPATEVYTWDADMPNSLRAFMDSKTALYFGYAYDIPTIKTQAPKLNFDITAMPQQSATPVNFANYWVETVSKKSKNFNEAWDFVLFMTANADNNKKYIAKAQKPVALRSLINWQKEQPGVNLLVPFVDQILTAKSWYKGRDIDAAEGIMKSLITNNLLGADKTDKLLSTAAAQINQTF